jgi:hypothetical protein
VPRQANGELVSGGLLYRGKGIGETMKLRFVSFESHYGYQKMYEDAVELFVAFYRSLWLCLARVTPGQ